MRFAAAPCLLMKAIQILSKGSGVYFTSSSVVRNPSNLVERPASSRAFLSPIAYLLMNELVLPPRQVLPIIETSCLHRPFSCSGQYYRPYARLYRGQGTPLLRTERNTSTLTTCHYCIQTRSWRVGSYRRISKEPCTCNVLLRRDEASLVDMQSAALGCLNHF